MANIASIIAAIAFAVLVLFLALPLWKLGKLFDQIRVSVREIASSTDLTVNELNATVKDAHAQLEHIDTVTTSSARVAQDISAISTLVSSSIARPLIRLAAFSQTTRDFVTKKHDQRNSRIGTNADPIAVGRHGRKSGE